MMQPPANPHQPAPPAWPGPGGGFGPPPPGRPSSSPFRVIGCILAVIGLAVVAFVGFFALVFVGVMGSLRTSDAYRTSIDFLKAQPVVLADLGMPIEEPLFVSGSINTSGSSGSAQLTIELEGPKGEGSASMQLTKAASKWTITSANWDAGGRSLNLLPAVAAPAATTAP